MASNVTPIQPEDPIAAKYAAMPNSVKSVVKQVVAAYRGQLIDGYEELQAAVNSTGKGGSFSVTLQVKPAKDGRFNATLEPRIRKAMAPATFDMHLDPDGQLVLGLAPAPPDPDDGFGD